MTTPLDDITYVEQSHDLRPSFSYRPGRTHDLDGRPILECDNGQLQFHRAEHVYRLMSPGNGFGKTTLAAVEAAWWGLGTHPWQRYTPDIPLTASPRQILWVAQKFQQFEMQKADIESWWPDEVRNSWNGKDHCYTWPDSSELFVITAETDWKTIQGTQPDLIMIDEECGPELWHELQRRRRARRKPGMTKYAITATATSGLTWTYRELYKPWLEYHAERGLTERDAMRVQQHIFPGESKLGVWCWPVGSHRDNPRADHESWAEQLNKQAGSKAEREVRLYGGYRDFAGQPVFCLDSLERMRKYVTPGRVGQFEEVKL